MQNSDTILRGLDKFIRKYYKNRMIKGGIYAFTLLLSLFLAMAVLEYFGYFGSVVRAIFFWFYLLSGLSVLGYYVVIPLLKMFRFGKVISYDEAARIIGAHFPEVQDKLLNLLQLQKAGSSQQSADSELLRAAIAQKSEQLSPIPFHQAVDIRGNRKYIKYAAIPAVIIVAMLLFSPTLLTESSRRITHYNTYYERPAPFTFKVENECLEVAQQEDFELRVAVEGDAVPAEAYVNIEGSVYRMQPIDKSHFTYLFKTVQRSCRFRLQAGQVQSPEYLLTVFPKPSVVDFQLHLSYPAYTGKPHETLMNEGDVSVPQGTVIKWFFHTREVDTLYFFEQEKVNVYVPDANGRITVTMRAMQTFEYAFSVANRYAPSDTLRYVVSSIADAAPLIAVVEMHDSLLADRRFFNGRIKDDYGFSKLEFVMLKTNVQDTSIKEQTRSEIALAKEAVQEFYYSKNLAEIVLAPGDKLVYYFEVWDNDAIHGPKSATSQQFELQVPTESELDSIIDRNSNEAQEQARMSMSELKKMQEDINELMRRLVDKKELNWQDKKDLQELAKKQQEVKEMLTKMQEQLKENKQLEQKYKDQSEKLMEKQRELDRLMNEVMNEEMKEMLKEIDKMMQEMDKKKVQEQLDKLKLDNEQLEKQLDQNIELMKRLEMEKKVEDAIRKAEQLSDKQRELSDKTEQAKDSKQKDEMLKEQQDLSQQYEELKQDIQQIQQEYKEIDKSLDFKVDKDLMQQIDQHQKGAEEKLGKGKQKDASKQQKQAADELDKLSEQLAEAQTDMEQQELAEDAEMVRHLLKNLVRLSFAQEALINDVRSVYIQDPKYQAIIVGQNKIKEDFRGVEDSLRAIAKRQLTVASVINKNVADVNSNLSKSLSGLLDMNQSFYGNYRNTQSPQPMQYTMTSFNSLALVLAESLDKMQSEMRQNQQKKNQGNCKNTGQKKQGNCSNPGKGKPSPKSMKQMQQELNKQMEALKKQLEKQGNKPGGRKKIGDQTGMQMSEEFARMAAQQEMIRRMMQEYGQELKQNGQGNAKMMKEIDEMMRQMEQTETDLVNKVITQQTIKRQQQIMTRLLEHEKAEMQREKEERRESHEGKEMPHQPTQSDIEQFKRLQEKNMELFRTVPPTLSPYYKSKVNDYFYRF